MLIFLRLVYEKGQIDKTECYEANHNGTKHRETKCYETNRYGNKGFNDTGLDKNYPKKHNCCIYSMYTYFYICKV